MSDKGNVDEIKENIIDTKNLSKIKIDLSNKISCDQENSENEIILKKI